MSERDKALRGGRMLLRCLLASLLLSSSVGCWEQWSEAWFPQMKWQKTVQAFERVDFEGRVEGFLPPEGAVPVGGVVPSYAQYDPAVDTLVNPTNPSDWKSIGRGQAVYESFCTTCHGESGMGNGPVSATAPGKPGPFAGIFPLVTATSRSDGYIYNLVRMGGSRMPSYQRIPDEDRWHLVNYVRYLQRGGRP